MIPQADIIAWRRVAPWADDAMVEQDLVLSRAVVEIFSDAALAQAFAFRGGTALHKVVLAPPSRYSEDIDLVQIEAGDPSTELGIGVAAIRSGRNESWAGTRRGAPGDSESTVAAFWLAMPAPRAARGLDGTHSQDAGEAQGPLPSSINLGPSVARSPSTSVTYGIASSSNPNHA